MFEHVVRWEDPPKGREARAKLKAELNPPIETDRSDVEANAKYNRAKYNIVILDPAVTIKV